GSANEGAVITVPCPANTTPPSCHSRQLSAGNLPETPPHTPTSPHTRRPTHARPHADTHAHTHTLTHSHTHTTHNTDTAQKSMIQELQTWVQSLEKDLRGEAERPRESQARARAAHVACRRR